VISELESLAAKDATTFKQGLGGVGSVIKEGIYEDRERRDQLLALAASPRPKMPACVR